MYPSFIEQLHWVDKKEAMKIISIACDTPRYLNGVLAKYNSILLAWLNAMMF